VVALLQYRPAVLPEHVVRERQRKSLPGNTIRRKGNNRTGFHGYLFVSDVLANMQISHRQSSAGNYTKNAITEMEITHDG